GRDGPAVLECFVVVHVLVVVGQVGDGLVDVGEVQVAGAGVGAGFRGDGGQGRGDCFRAAVQDSQALSVGPLAGGGGVAGVQCGGSLAEVAADVDEVDEDGDFQPAGSGVGVEGGGVLLFGVREEQAVGGVWGGWWGSRRSAWSYALAIIAGMSSVMEADTHLSRAAGPGWALRRAGGAAMSSGCRTAGVKSATATISAIFLVPARVVEVGSFLRCSGRSA